MQTIKQPPGSKLCLAACCAMLAGTSLKDVLAEVQLHPKGWLPMREAIIFLAKRGMMPGLYLVMDDIRLGEIEDFNVPFDVKSTPAIVAVYSSMFGGCTHAIVWDHERGLFRDPNSGHGETTFPIKYKLREWWPIMQIGEES